MSRRRRYQGLAARFLLAQLLVVAVSLLAAVVVVMVAGPPIFHEHLVMAGRSEGSAELTHAEQAYREANLIVLAVALSTALVCALLVSAWCSRRIRHPLDRLSAAAQAMAGGRYDTRVPAMGAGTEVEDLAGSFNTMAARLQRTEDTRRRMLSDLAHELRTPVSVLSVYHEALQDGVSRWDEPTGELMGDQLARLTRLVEDINDVSRAEEGRIELDRTTEPVAGLLHAAAEAHREAYTAKGVVLSLDADPGLAVDVDRQRMGQVLGNLLTNALRHTPPGGQVSLEARQGPSGIRLRVIDTGEGISPEHLPHIFERFYRGDTARDRDHGGSGVGLAISRALVQAHGGTLTATSAGPGTGATFTIDLPSDQSARSSSAKPCPPPLE
ncbi:HAMP domain-containing sensor histidine kinase [Citricoccus sp.]|uniref:HAMP domain-containing sensor histidine kinase n=1 Tax=Citricoccus sp. TaxID=1978372 RepID=UPI002609C867|nr:HAMP domain-containing sensor histidine kinase [Citricoccus sp.]HRO93989.1 HAMP domain-containing sensor histidine kinase [Citricoccus sp.]